MKRETYKGRKLKVVKTRGADWGYARLTVNGVDMGRYLGDEDNALRSAKGTIDHADEVGVGSARYADHWYAPGTYELCENGHAQEIGGLCGHSYCIERRPVPAAAETTPEPVKGFVPCWDCRQPATHILTREGSKSLNACGRHARIDRDQAESRGWAVHRL